MSTISYINQAPRPRYLSAERIAQIVKGADTDTDLMTLSLALTMRADVYLGKYTEVDFIEMVRCETPGEDAAVAERTIQTFLLLNNLPRGVYSDISRVVKTFNRVLGPDKDGSQLPSPGYLISIRDRLLEIDDGETVITPTQPVTTPSASLDPIFRRDLPESKHPKDDSSHLTESAPKSDYDIPRMYSARPSVRPIEPVTDHPKVTKRFSLKNFLRSLFS